MLRDDMKTGRVLVKFEAPWCAPCKAMQPTLDKLVTEANGSFTLVKVNVDEDFELAQAMGVRGVPALAAVVDGTVVGTMAGANNFSAIRAFLNNAVGL